VEVRAVSDDGHETVFSTRARVDNETEIGYMHHGGILPLVLRQLTH
jgi:aconitase A